MTPVLFRKYKTTPQNIVAVFPTLPGDNTHGSVQVYEHTGQHGSARYFHIMAITTPATPDEAHDLHRELIRQGYGDLQIAHRKTRSARTLC